jgi:hypothetical protein
MLIPPILEPKLTVGAAGSNDDRHDSHSLTGKAADQNSAQRDMLRRIPIRTLQQSIGNRGLARLFQETRRAPAGIDRRASPYIKKVTVHLTPTQSADLEWEGAPPADAPGSDHFTVSTGKGYSDSGDPAGTCKRDCCEDADKQCAPPCNQPGSVGACCTYFGNNFWTGDPIEKGANWPWWTPIQPYYSSRGIALHEHSDVTGQPIGHGCVRMKGENAERIAKFSNGRKTNVTIDGRAAPVQCKDDQKCKKAAGGAHGSGASGGSGQPAAAGAAAAQEVVPGREGAMS